MTRTLLVSAVSTAITRSLLDRLPSETATRFNINQEEFTDFLRSFLTEQLGKSMKGKRANSTKGTNGKGRISGFLLFSNQNRTSVREDNPDMKFTDVGRRLGEMWKDLTQNEREEWNQRAVQQNEENGLPTPTPSSTQQESTKVSVVRNKEPDAWVIKGTQYVVRSRSNKSVIGRVRNGKVVKLSASDVTTCNNNNWPVEDPTSKKRTN